MNHLKPKGWEAVKTSIEFHIYSYKYAIPIWFADFSLPLSPSNKVQIIQVFSRKNNESSLSL